MTGLSNIPPTVHGRCRCDGLLLLLTLIVPTILTTVLSTSPSQQDWLTESFMPRTSGCAAAAAAHLLQKPRIRTARYWLAMMRSTPCSVDLH